MNCPVCSSVSAKPLMANHDDRYAYPGTFALLKCKQCRHIYLDIDMNPEQLGKLYTNYYPRKSFDVANFKPHVEANNFQAWLNGSNSSAFRAVPKNVRILDVGCGFGQSLGYHTARGCDVYGVEADENIRRVADKFGFKVHVGLFDDTLYEAEFFDYVTMDQVIEHVTDPLSTLKGVGRILKHGGIAILSTPNAGGWGATLFGRRWINWHTPYHIQFFTRCSMLLAAKQAGLQVVKVKTTTNSEWLLYQWMHLVTYPKRGEPSLFWSPNHNERTLLQNRILKVLRIIHKYKINHLITRIFDSLGWGDNYVFILKKP